jgi:cephalosporin hydroxylase
MDDFSVQVDLGDRQISFTQTEITNLFHTLYYGSRVWEKTYYRGHNILKCPLDMWIYQEMIHELKPDYIIACYDLPQKTFRHEAYKEYKAPSPQRL